MISHPRRCIFVHIPRTGGTSVEDAIWPGPRTEADLWMGFVSTYRNRIQTGGLQHLFARHIRDEVGPVAFAAYWKFAFVRNPWDRLVSQFRYLQKRADLRDLLGLALDSPFRDYLDRIRQVPHVQWEPQSHFLDDEGGRSLVDFVGRFERFAADARLVLDRLGLAGVPVPHVNATDRRPYPDYYDADSAALVGRLYAEDARRFGYRFGD